MVKTAADEFIHCKRCTAALARLDENTPALKIFDAVPGGEGRGRGRSPLSWKYLVAKDLAILGISD